MEVMTDGEIPFLLWALRLYGNYNEKKIGNIFLSEGGFWNLSIFQDTAAGHVQDAATAGPFRSLGAPPAKLMTEP